RPPPPCSPSSRHRLHQGQHSAGRQVPSLASAISSLCGLWSGPGPPLAAAACSTSPPPAPGTPPVLSPLSLHSPFPHIRTPPARWRFPPPADAEAPGTEVRPPTRRARNFCFPPTPGLAGPLRARTTR